MTEKIQILELFGGIGAPRAALRNLGIPVKSIDYVEVDQAAVSSYNAMFPDRGYDTQSVVGWTLKPDILIHGSPCQDFSIAGHQGPARLQDGRVNVARGGDESSNTRSSLMWETVRIIREMGEWRPKVVLWENVKNLLSKHMIHNYEKYLSVMESMGYTNSTKLIDARSCGIPQARQRVYTVSVLGKTPFDFSKMPEVPMKGLDWYLEKTEDTKYIVTQPTVYNAIGKGNGEIRRAVIIHDFVNTITTRQDRTPTQVIDLGGGRYRYLTELECWRLQGFDDMDFRAAESTCPVKPGKMNRTLYHQAGNSIPIPVLEAIFKEMIRQGLFPDLMANRHSRFVV